MPDTVASALHDMGLISDGYADTMWAAVQGESNSACKIAREERSQARLAVEAEKLARVTALKEVQAFAAFLRKQSRANAARILIYLAWRHGSAERSAL
jgi:hypothetical protein